VLRGGQSSVSPYILQDCLPLGGADHDLTGSEAKAGYQPLDQSAAGVGGGGKGLMAVEGLSSIFAVTAADEKQVSTSRKAREGF